MAVPIFAILLRLLRRWRVGERGGRERDKVGEREGEREKLPVIGMPYLIDQRHWRARSHPPLPSPPIHTFMELHGSGMHIFLPTIFRRPNCACAKRRRGFALFRRLLLRERDTFEHVQRISIKYVGITASDGKER